MHTIYAQLCNYNTRSVNNDKFNNKVSTASKLIIYQEI